METTICGLGFRVLGFGVLWAQGLGVCEVWL